MDCFYHEELGFDTQSPMQLWLHRGDINYVILEHWHRSLEINYMIDCETELFVNGEKQILHTGDVALINSGDIHSMVPVGQMKSEEGKLRAATLFISYDVLKRSEPDIERTTFDLSKSEEKLEELKEIYREMIRIRVAPEEEYGQLLLNGLLYRFPYLLLTYFKIDCGSESAKSQKYIDRIRKVLDYMDVHYQEPLTLQGTASEFSVSMEYLSRVMKKYTGHTFKEHLNQVRLTKAFEQLMQTDFSMTEIAMNNGFSDVRAFISVFKDNYGVTPLQFKKRNMQQNINQVADDTEELIENKPHVRRLK